MARLYPCNLSIVFTLLLIGSMLFSATADAREKSLVRVNPFARPVVVKQAPVARSGTAQGVGNTASQAIPELRGVLQAGANSFANVGGVIVGLGERVANMTLHRVTDTAAVFIRNGRKVTLEVSSTIENAVADESATRQTSGLAGQEIPAIEGRDKPAPRKTAAKALKAIDISDIEKDKRSASQG